MGCDLPTVRVGIASLQRPVQHLHRVRAARYLDDWCGRAVGTGEVLREAFWVDRRGGDDQFEIRALWQQILQIPQEEVDVQAAFVSLIDDDRVVLAEEPVALNLVEQHTVGHELDRGVLAGLIVEADLITDQGIRFIRAGAELLCDAVCHAAGGDAPGLGVSDALALAAPKVEAHLRDLRGFTGTSLTGDDDDLVFSDSLFDIRLPLRDGQLAGEVDPGEDSVLLRQIDRGRAFPTLLAVAPPTAWPAPAVAVAPVAGAPRRLLR